MPIYYTPEKLWELFQKLPQELKSLIFSEKTAQDIQIICEKYLIKDEKTISAIANYVGYVLHGVLAVESLQSVLEKEAGLKNGVAERVARDINQIIFFPVKTSLQQLYNKPNITEEKIVEVKNTEIEKKTLEVEKKIRPTKNDSYREPIE